MNFNNFFDYKIILFLVCLVLSIVEFIVYLIVKGSNKYLEYKNSLAKILQLLPDYITNAEQMFGSGNGVTKLHYVLNNVHMKCLELGLNFVESDWRFEIERILFTPTTLKGGIDYEETVNEK